MEFLNHQKLKYSQDNDELEYTEGIVEDLKNVDFPAQFLRIELEQEVGDTGTKALLDPPTEQ